MIKHLNSKSIFLMDGLGAIATALLLFFVLKPFDRYFGMPQAILSCLSLIAFLFCVYSLSCYFLLKKTWKPFLKGIIAANLIYCGITTALLLYNYSSLSALGLIYFSGEVLIIAGLVFIEIKILAFKEKPAK